MSSSMIIQDLSFFTEIAPDELANVAGGALVSVDTTNEIEQGRARIRADIRPGLKDKNFTGTFENCTGTFDDFKGTLQITCNLSAKDVNSGQVIFLAPISGDN